MRVAILPSLTTALMALAIAPALALGDEVNDTAGARYREAIQEASQAIAEGNPDRVLDLLDVTDPALRGFEFEALDRAARFGQQGGSGLAIDRVATPEGVQARYGRLNPVTLDVAFICADGTIRVRPLRNPDAPFRVVEASTDRLWSGAFSLDGSTFAAGDEQGTVTVWNATTWEQVASASVGNRPVRELAVAPDGSAFAAEGETSMVLWDVHANRKIGDVGERYNFGEGIAFSPDGRLVASGGMFDVLLFDAKTAEPVRSFEHASYTMTLAFGPDASRIASATRGNISRLLAVFEVESGRKRFDRQPAEKYVLGIAFSPNGRRLAATGCDNALLILDADSGAEIVRWPRSVCGNLPTFSADGRVLAWSEPGGLMVIDLDTTPDPDRAPEPVPAP
ncbi:WD40 repeat domain-containing protein [Tautonia rosea]|uniref:WD40 repeat domain-containing protein n=1 Tax=Tautonia rosea TaxID=2728037 RepID=UPI00147401AA|nr:hypothetical protein [Tautonia rosea]